MIATILEDRAKYFKARHTFPIRYRFRQLSICQPGTRLDDLENAKLADHLLGKLGKSVYSSDRF